MACEILNCCRFFDEKMRDLPKTTAYIKQKMCLDDYRSCSRFRIFNKLREGQIPLELHPDDMEEAKRVMQCLVLAGMLLADVTADPADHHKAGGFEPCGS